MGRCLHSVGNTTSSDRPYLSGQAAQAVPTAPHVCVCVCACGVSSRFLLPSESVLANACPVALDHFPGELALIIGLTDTQQDYPCPQVAHMDCPGFQGDMGLPSSLLVRNQYSEALSVFS